MYSLKKFFHQIKFFLLFLFFLIIIFINHNEKMKKRDDSNKRFLLINVKSETICGLLYLYFVNIGCVNYYISKGYIPVIDLITYPNVYNKFNTSLNYNPWEQFFYQPYNHTLDNVKKYAKRIEYKNFSVLRNEPNYSIELFYNNRIRLYWYF